jgi:hypothetical protein
MRTTTDIAMALILLFAAVGPASAQDRDTLKGLRAVDVLIERPAEEAERDGLTAVALRVDVESQLREGGLEVSTDAPDTFYINVNAHRTNPAETRYMYNIEVRVSQPVRLLRTDAVALASTWSRAILGTTVMRVLSDSVRQDLRDLVATFLGDYLAVNPRP